MRIDPALATLVPPGTVLLAGANLDHLRKAPLYAKIGPLPVEPLAGLDAGDIWELLLSAGDGNVAVMARGRFSTSGLEPRISVPGAVRSSYKGYTLIGTGANALVFLNPTTAVGGRPEAVRSIIDGRSDGSGPPEPLAREIAEIPPEFQIWAAGSGAAAGIAPRGGNLANAATALRLIETFRAGVAVDAGLKFSLTALCRSDQDAGSLSAALGVLLAMGRLNPDPALKPAWDAIKVEQAGRTVRVNAALPPVAAEKLLSGVR